MGARSQVFAFQLVALLLTQLALAAAAQAQSRGNPPFELGYDDPYLDPGLPAQELPVPRQRKPFTNGDALRTEATDGAILVGGSAASRLLTARKVERALDRKIGTLLMEKELRPKALNEKEIQDIVEKTRARYKVRDNARFPELAGPVIELELDHAQSERMIGQESSARVTTGPNPPPAETIYPARADRGWLGGFQGIVTGNTDEYRPNYTKKSIFLNNHGRDAFAHLESQLNAIRDDATAVRAARGKTGAQNLLGRTVGVVGTAASLVLFAPGMTRLLNGGRIFIESHTSSDEELLNHPYLNSTDEKPSALESIFSSAGPKAYAIEQENRASGASRAR
ncbi:MAG: hypothetical protein NDJ89_09430 [Oligoflexia bacterium]|nr:hypothetical protein [Oligoflexia bacterium]